MTIILTKDLNKNILRITYNFLNLPKEIMFMDGSYIHYTYDAAGTLLRKGYFVNEELTEIPGDDEEELTGFRLPDTHLMSVGDEEEEKELVEEEEEIPYTDVTDYCGNCIYENGTLKMILIEDGYVTFDSNSQPVYHFYLQDHLGNNRVVANASGQVEQVNHYYPYGGLMAESTGGDVQRYKYNGKELDRMLGLDWYDYGARHYDGALTMWGTVDPLCEKYYNISPYVYCGNNPINAFDPDGRKKHNWIKGQGRYNNASIQDRFENRYGKKFAQIWAHGLKESPNSKAWGIEVHVNYLVKKENNYIKGNESLIVSKATELSYLLNKFDGDWKTDKNGQAILILHACSTSDFAKEISKSEVFKDVIIIAPTENVYTSANGDERVSTTDNSLKGLETSGRWVVYKNGSPLLDQKGNPITYSYDSQVGTKGFDYGF